MPAGAGIIGLERRGAVIAPFLASKIHGKV